MPDASAVRAAARRFAASVTAKMTQLSVGEPEDQLRAPIETLMAEIGEVLGLNVVCTGEVKLAGRLGKPDYAVHSSKLLAGYLELKAPGVGANPSRFTGHNRDQWKRFEAIPNILYTDGNDWGLYRNGKAERRVVCFSGDVTADGANAVSDQDADSLLSLLVDFLSWQPILPFKPKGGLDIRRFAALLAPLCRMLRDDVHDALQDAQSPLVQLARDWRQLLFPDADDEQFADAYAQTVTFALLLARSEGADPLALQSAQDALTGEHGLLSRALQILTDQSALAEISASLRLLIRVIGEVPSTALTGADDPWLYFYEDFLAAYDPELRRDAGAYYTPVEVVRAQVRLVDDLLRNSLGMKLGFAHPDVVTLDPAAGTGTYLLGVIDHALGKVRAREGAGAVPGRAKTLAGNLYGFEIMVGPFAVTELRVSRALLDRGAELPPDGTHVYLTDTLESPDAKPPQLPLFLKPIADQHRRALDVKANVPVIVCLGNPPYDRHPAVDANDAGSLGRCGGWVRFGDELPGGVVQPRGRRTTADPRVVLKKREERSILYSGFVRPAVEAGHGGDIKNLYNLYVYFWRWALWKVLEQGAAAGGGVVSFISASSYLDGDAFSGMREHMRRLCDEIWIVDLGGEGRGARRTENVFAIQTPVCIAVAVRYPKHKRVACARVHYACLEGSRDDKLHALDCIQDLRSLAWEDCPDEWQAPFRPARKGGYFGWPLLSDLFPWQHSGVQLKRTWPIAPDRATLKARWRALLTAEDRSAAFHGTGDREITGSYQLALTPRADATAISELPADAEVPPVVRYAYRSLDRQYLIADARLISRPRPDLWQTRGSRQVFLATAFTQAIGAGPALTASADIPDLHFFSGRGAKDIVPLYRDTAAQHANVLPGLLALLSGTLGFDVGPDDFAAYVYGVLASPAFTERYATELGSRELRVPITKDAALFAQMRDTGARLLWLHTYGERFIPAGCHYGDIPKSEAECVKPILGDAEHYPETFEYDDTARVLQVGEGRFAPVASEVYEYEVSGLKVVQSWLRYRMKGGAGRRSSPLDGIQPEHWGSEFTTELLELLWVLEATTTAHESQCALLDALIEGECFGADELPAVPAAARKPPEAISDGSPTNQLALGY